MAEFIKINPADNVAVAIKGVSAGSCCVIDDLSVTPLADIPAGHKMALCDIAEGENVVKYGFPIGHTLQAVPAGGLIDHTNLKTNLEGLLEYSYQPELTEIVPAEKTASFRGDRKSVV